MRASRERLGIAFEVSQAIELVRTVVDGLVVRTAHALDSLVAQLLVEPVNFIVVALDIGATQLIDE